MKIDKLNQISTKNGDKGTSRNYNNESFKKSDILFETLGTIDELNSYLGLTYHQTKLEQIIKVQKTLQYLNSIIATNPNADFYKKLYQINEQDVDFLEKEIQTLLDIKPLEPRFTLPGSEKSLEGAYFDYARTLARKAERRVIEFAEMHHRNDLVQVKKYINRLSDYLYVLSCNF